VFAEFQKGKLMVVKAWWVGANVTLW
jgi:hypothetical protein